MKRIFLTLALIATAFLITAIVLGLNIGGLYFPESNELNPKTQSQISTHMLVGVGALVFAFLVHAISLTYFMGTGRWIEETSNAYSLDASFYKQNQKIKYGTLPGSTLCMLLLVATAALGAVADPATPASLDGLLGMTSTQIHFFTAIGTCIINLIVNFSQFVAISKNANVVEAVLAEVHRIRTERGLPV